MFWFTLLPAYAEICDPLIHRYGRMDHYRPGSIVKVDSRKLDKFGTSLSCNKYVSPNITDVIKYKVTYVVFNREMTKLTKQDASALALEGSTSSFKAPVIGGKGREATASATNTVPAAKIEIRGDEANPAGFEGKYNSRKQP
uniref:Uncharacterized protein n=1 Tax=Brassica campestris TaxID=3711 RepID=M4EHC0_BRACM